jgi:hypothetical protein
MLNHVALLKPPLPQLNVELVSWYITKSGFGVGYNNRELKHVGRQHDDDGQNKFLQINDSKENLSCIIIRMNLIQYNKLKTLAWAKFY